jgi:hypothetical protein
LESAAADTSDSIISEIVAFARRENCFGRAGLRFLMEDFMSSLNLATNLASCTETKMGTISPDIVFGLQNVVAPRMPPGTRPERSGFPINAALLRRLRWPRRGDPLSSTLERRKARRRDTETGHLYPKMTAPRPQATVGGSNAFAVATPFGSALRRGRGRADYGRTVGIAPGDHPSGRRSGPITVRTPAPAIRPPDRAAFEAPVCSACRTCFGGRARGTGRPNPRTSRCRVVAWRMSSSAT